LLAWGSCLALAAGWAGSAPAHRDPASPPGDPALGSLAQPTPTGDRLAAPPTVEDPSQADTGAQLYWLNCQPCHGDVGQGLTDDWRAQYPPEDQNCWGRGCHGERPYADGFTLPKFVPAVIGPQALARFSTAADLHRYLSQVMPFNAPASLSEAEYWALTAFLMRANEMPPPGTPAPQLLDDVGAASLIGLHGPLVTPTPLPTLSPASSGLRTAWPVLILAGLVMLGVLGVAAWRQRLGRNKG